MKKRSSSLPLLVVVAVVALVLGSFGTATAAGLTKSTVKKIATKVVNKKAPGLSVASAANATNLAGQPASTYMTSATRFRLPSGAAAGTKDYSFSLAPGVYSVTYAVIALTTGTASDFSCALFPSASTASGSEGRTYGTPANFGNYWAATGGATLNLTTGVATLECFSSGSTFTINPDASTLSQVTFSRIRTLTDATATGGRAAERGSGGTAG